MSEIFWLTVQGNSMSPALYYPQEVEVDPRAYRQHSPRRGDLIAFSLTAGGQPHLHSIKRVIGLPGETIEIQGGAVVVDGEALREPYIRQAAHYTFGPRRIPRGGYFVLGDNRNSSYDSSKWPRPWVRRGEIAGKVIGKTDWEVRASYILTGDFVPDAISSLAGMEPDWAWQRDEMPRSTAGVLPQASHWIVRSQLPVTAGLADQISAVLDRLEPAWQHFIELGTRYKAGIQCVTYLHVEEAPTTVLDAGTLRRLVELRACLDTEVHSLPNLDGEHAERPASS